MELYSNISSAIAQIMLLCNSTLGKRYDSQIIYGLDDISSLPPFLENLQMDFLKRAGALAPDETPMYSEGGTVYYGNRHSMGLPNIILTDRRIVVFGGFGAEQLGNNDVNRLYYDDMTENQIYLNIDYIHYDRILEMKNNWSWRGKYIEILYDSKYLQEKGYTLFGPYFFKFEWASKAKIKKGPIRIEMTLARAEHPTLSKSDFTKKRQEELFKRLSEYYR